MPLQCHVFIAVSLDGFIARPNGDIDWLTSLPPIAGEDFGYQEFWARMQALVVGRGTYEQVLGFPEWPYAGKRVIVLSTRPESLPQPAGHTVEAWSASPAETAARLEQAGVGRVYIDGGRTIQGFLRAGLIDELILTRLPLLLGAGRPLFGPLDGDQPLRHVETRTYANGLVQSTYRRVEAS